MYKYILLKQDGSKKDLGVSKKKKSLEELYRILQCTFVEIIPTDYYKGLGYGKCTMWGDEEARFNEKNVRNPHFNVLKGNVLLGELAEWDVVGNILMEQKEK
jgi:hypothetical protein